MQLQPCSDFQTRNEWYKCAHHIYNSILSRNFEEKAFSGDAIACSGSHECFLCDNALLRLPTWPVPPARRVEPSKAGKSYKVRSIAL